MANQIEGIDYSPDGIEDIRTQLIALRNESLNQNEFAWAVILSHAIAMLADYKDIVSRGDG